MCYLKGTTCLEATVDSHMPDKLAVVEMRALSLIVMSASTVQAPVPMDTLSLTVPQASVSDVFLQFVFQMYIIITL